MVVTYLARHYGSLLFDMSETSMEMCTVAMCVKSALGLNLDIYMK